ncbi:MAG: thioredoxin domain-containing protein [Oscillospiraceae bacterium]|nr:thioredoxin domain-containing protein [Oscillospiraceae bacterium]
MNLLQYEKSPYLLQHAGNPVRWQPWGQAAFDAAIREDKPIFLSIGYSTCHWCHVMAQDSFEDEAVAAAINRDYIPVKVDREERPDVDAVYMAACVAMNGSGGWPLTVLLTPDRKPFWAGTYLPKRQLLSLLAQASELWRENRAGVLRYGETLTAQLQGEQAHTPGEPSRALVKAGVEQLAALYDANWGGFGRAPKFPTPHNLIFLLRYAGLTGDGAARAMAEGTLEHMLRGGIFDHIGGGFCRYSTDEKWLVPHFEKMLYDNALLSLAYAEAFAHTRRPVFRNIACRTLDFALRELSDPQGGFYCGQDADSGGSEGLYYLLTPQDVSSALDADTAQRFCDRFNVTPQGNFEGKSIPNLIRTPDWETESSWAEAARKKLYRYRRERTELATDDKVLTAWNALMLAALARVGLLFSEPRYLEAATRAAAFIREHLTHKNGSLLARWRSGDAAHAGKLDDYAFAAWGLLELYSATFQTTFLSEACRLTGLLLDDSFDSEQGGFYPYSSQGEQLITRTKESYDGAMPSGNAVAALVLSRLARLTGEARFRTAKELQFRYLAGAIRDYPAGHCFSLLAMLEELWPTAELVCAARELPAELPAFLRRELCLNLTVLLKTPENAQQLAQIAPFTEAYPIPPTGVKYYLCRGGTCQSPADSLEALERQIEAGM